MDSPSATMVDKRRQSPSTSPPLSTSSRPIFTRSPASNPNLSSLPPLITPQSVNRRTSSTRIPSIVNKRLSTLSSASGYIQRSRPQSVVFPAFHSSLPYALVRDFAYDINNPLHYGPSQDPGSAASTTPSEFARRLSDPLIIPFQGERGPWSGAPGSKEAANYGGIQLPATSFGDGPPWREDEDLLSPVVTNSRHRKVKSDVDYFSRRDRDISNGGRRTSYVGTTEDGNPAFYVDRPEEDEPGGPGGEIITYTSPDSGYEEQMRTSAPQFASEDYRTVYDQQGLAASYDTADDDESRFSRDYSFTIASPDEEMHGKAIALYDFESENDNELPLVEGQVLWISYRHGQGWLVAKDPSTGEDGLVPEAYVRLEKDIQGGFNGLNGQPISDIQSPIGPPDTPTLPSSAHDRPMSGSSSHRYSDQRYVPIVSHFTTSSKDVRVPQARRDSNQVSTPTASSGPMLAGTSFGERAPASDAAPSGAEDSTTDEDEDEDEDKTDEVQKPPAQQKRQEAVTDR